MLNTLFKKKKSSKGNSVNATEETKKCLRCLRRIALSYERCPHCRYSEFEYAG